MKALGWIGIIATVVTTSQSYAAGGTVGNGGDGVAAEFVLTAQTASELLSKIDLKDVPEFNLNSFAGAIVTSQVNSEDSLFLNGQEVDAINYPSQHKLRVSRARWMPIRGESGTVDRFLLVTHEYLWLSGTDDTNYRVSKILIQRMSPSKFSTTKWWEPMNPTNELSISYTTPACTSGGIFVSFDLTKDAESSSVDVKSSCSGGPNRTVQLTKETRYGASTDGIKGSFHLFEIKVFNESKKLIGKVQYTPNWGQCLVTTDYRCPQSGDIRIENLIFRFSLVK